MSKNDSYFIFGVFWYINIKKMAPTAYQKSELYFVM